MSTQPFVIIGGDAAGMSAASKIKRDQPDAHVIVFERDPYISYSACGMPYWLAGVVESDRRLIVLTPERARERRGIDVRIGHEVTAIDPAAQTVTVRQVETGATFVQPYTSLLLATGAAAVRPPLPGLDLPGVFTLRTLNDARHIQHFLTQQEPKRAVIIGGGYIGLEMAEALHARGLAVTVVELLPQLMPNFDAELVEPVTAHLAEEGVTVLTGRRVLRVEAKSDQLAVVSAAVGQEDGEKGQQHETAADLVLVATGVRPNRELAVAAGLRIGQTGAIWVDEHMRTSDPHIYAAGDCVEHYHPVLGENAWIPLATSANKGGRIAGENMAGGNAVMPGILGTAVVKVFAYTMAVTGLTEQAARASGKFGADGADVAAAVIEENDRASYWPGVVTIKVKLVCQRSTGRILGGQMMGKDGVNKRIDIIATAIHAQMTVMELGYLDLSYAPPYSSPWDPVQVCANVAAKLVNTTTTNS